MATKKKKEPVNKSELWNIFDSELSTTPSLECMYRAEGNREICDQCSSNLAFSDEGFLTCTNVKCGIIYKDMLNQEAEWKFYGADDNQRSDPTRCGMPTNPLLKESSFGCKVVCNGKTSY